MRNKVELENGTVLEVGKKYVHATRIRNKSFNVLCIGEDWFFFVRDNGYEGISEIDNDWIPYEEEKTEKWYEVIVYNSFGVGNRRCCNEINLKNYECQIDIIREWDSKEEMIKELKK
jgi:hypothetical protein